MSDESESQTSARRAEKPTFLTHTPFYEFNLPSEVLRGLSDAGFAYCTPIQAQTLALSLSGRDVAGQAQTGTGKTAAFLVTIFTRLLSQTKRKSKFPSALIVAPTRELAFQIYQEANVLGRYAGFKTAQVVGGVDYNKQASILGKGVDIIIGTPGRIIDFYKQGIFKTDGTKIVVIDEADRLLDLGFAKDMRYILRQLPSYNKRQSMLFSATLSYRVMELTYEYMNMPEFIAITPEEVTVEGIEQSVYHVGLDNKLPLLMGLLEKENWTRVLIFVNTKAGVEWLTAKLRGNGWPAEGITGDLPQPKRFRLMGHFKNGTIKILVATDVASRGIHVEDISHIINYDLPQDAENYVHRVGRTARAGKTGRALSLACERYVFHLQPLEEMLGYKIPVVWPEDDWFVKDKCEPVSIAIKGRKGKTARGRGRVKKRLTRLKPTEKKWKRTHPGAFFGFAPEPETATKTKSSQTPTPPPKKKRRTRRKKKNSTPDSSKPGSESTNSQT